MNQRRILVTSALPYANGPIHLGHLVEYIQTDVWVRFQKLCGENCHYFCADDTHGTAIMIAAKKEGISEEEFIARTNQSHQESFSAFNIEFDHYGSTNSEETRHFCHEIWNSIRKVGLVQEKEIEQLYDTVAETFLADRFVRGTCPKCGRPNQYGDSCDCGAVYSPTDLIDPKSTLSGSTPELRKSLHLFVDLEQLHDFLETWVDSENVLQPEIANYLKGQFLSAPLWPWDISRPAPYFGFEIPDSPGNYWYVWFDAPIGYIGSTLQWAKNNGENIDFWWKNPETEIHHFIGKDITYFHTLFWPAMLKTAGFTLPKKVHIHGFLTVDGEKMSKSKGTFIQAETFAKYLNPSYLRYFFSSKMSSRVDDLDLNFEEMEAKINADLVGNIVNIASRTAKFAALTGLSEEYPEDGGLFRLAADASTEIAAAYEDCDFGKAIRLILECGFRANKYIEETAPWSLRKNWVNLDKNSEASPTEKDAAFRKLQDSVTVSLNLFRQIIIYLTPILPELTLKTETLLNTKISNWNDVQSPILGGNVNEYQHMMTRVPKEGIKAMIEETKAMNNSTETPNSAVSQNSSADSPSNIEPQTTENEKTNILTEAPEVSVPVSDDEWKDSGQPLLDEPMSDMITIDDFLKVDLRVGRIVEAEQVPEARKLLKLKISLGGNQTRQVFAGIKAAYPEPEKLVGRLVVFVANLKPRQMKFGLSEGMVVAAGPGGPEVFLMSPDSGAKPGQRLH
ncbi:MAG: methionine--tRNA ligase [Planctomycetia bacterium]|nr:methionine--tRNA ligase [Planctomycetia bacterium]